MNSPMWINGRQTEQLDASDRGLHYGDGLFETLLIHAGRPVLLTQHLKRLQAGCERLQIPMPENLDQEINAFLLKADAIDAVLKIIVSRGPGGRGYRPPAHPQTTRILQLHPVPPDARTRAEQGIRAMLCQHPLSCNPRLAGLKHLNRLDQVMASSELGEHIDEGLMSDGTGQLIEGTRSNVFLLHQEQWFTPDLRRAGVAGILRSWLLERFAEEDWNVTVGDIPCHWLDETTEMFICNSVLGVWPVTALELESGRRALAVGKLARRAQQLWSGLLKS